MEKYEKQVLEKLLTKRNVTETGCWEWTGTCFSNGYGQVKFKGRTWRVNRLIMLLLRPSIYYTGLCMLHKCDNPKCFNPDHIYAGTVQDNKDDETIKGRNSNGNKEKEYCIYGHPFTPENTYYRPSGGRTCRICKRDNNKLYEKTSARSLWRSPSK